MVFLILIGICTIFFLVLVGHLKMRNLESSSRMINAEWLDPADKFNLIARWGA